MKLDWEKIKKDSPKAWGEFHKTFHWLEIREGVLGHAYTDGIHVVQMWSGFNYRKLFTFFDEREIYVTIMYMEVENTFWWGIDYGIFCAAHCDGIALHKSRTEAESAAFSKAFEILEERLNKEA